MATFIVRVARDFIPPCGIEEFEIEADSQEEAGKKALDIFTSGGKGGFVSSVWAKNPPRFQMPPLELALLERDEARTEALALRYALERLIAWLDRPTTTAPEASELTAARNALFRNPEAS